SQLKNNAKEI
nr:Chain C, INFLUENZA A PEPTIDE [Influenza A virus]